MDALDAHPGKGRKEEVVQQPCNHRAEKLPRNRRERERQRFYNFSLNKTVKKVVQYSYTLSVFCNLYSMCMLRCTVTFYFHFHKVNYLQVE